MKSLMAACARCFYLRSWCLCRNEDVWRESNDRVAVREPMREERPLREREPCAAVKMHCRGIARHGPNSMVVAQNEMRKSRQAEQREGKERGDSD